MKDFSLAQRPAICSTVTIQRVMIEHLRKLWCAGTESPHGIELLRSLSHSVALDQGDDNKSYVKVVD